MLISYNIFNEKNSEEQVKLNLIKYYYLGKPSHNNAQAQPKKGMRLHAKRYG